jgi:hypothetical protein
VFLQHANVFHASAKVFDHLKLGWFADVHTRDVKPRQRKER